MASERTFIAIKPDGVQRGLVGEIIKRFEQRGYKSEFEKKICLGNPFLYDIFTIFYTILTFKFF